MPTLTQKRHTITTLSSRQFNQEHGKAKKAAQAGPVFITDRGRATHVLLSIDDYNKLGEKPQKTLADMISMPPEFWGKDDIEFDTSRPVEYPRAADFS